jgi:hypothetical protein
MLPPTVTDVVERQHTTIRGAYARLAEIGSARKLGV